MIYDLADRIAEALCKYGRIKVSDAKEKFGTYRVYVNFGFYGLQDIMFPRCRYDKFPKSLTFLAYGPDWFFELVNFAVVRYQFLIYKLVYEYFIRKYPREINAIVLGMDYPELISEKYLTFFNKDKDL